MSVGNTVIPVVVTAADGETTMTYTVTVTRPPEVFAFNAAEDVPVIASVFDATGLTANFALGFAPPPGTVLTVVNQTGLEFIRGAFANLSQGQEVELEYMGVRYRFVANYHGGTGNDLVLQWANVRLMAWGRNSSGQIGNGGEGWNGSSYTNSKLLVPTAVDASGVLAGKTVVTAAVGGNSSLALCSEGTLASWGVVGGKLDNGTYATAVVPVLVDRSGALSNKTVVALAVGSEHRLALCADGTVAAWGENTSGQLGNNSTTSSTVPVLVDTSGILAGRKVVKIAATGNHSLALCGDGTLVAWGENSSGQLGNNSTLVSSVPVLVETGGVLYGRRVVEIAAGGGHSAALCADGTLAVWGRNSYGQLGLGNKIDTKVPVLLPMTGVLAGKTIRGVSVSYYHSMVWATDGTLAAWGYNATGGLGNNSTTESTVPVAVVRSGVLSRKTITGMSAGWFGGGALCSDGSMATWGGNEVGQLGNNSTTSSSVPVLVDTTGLRPGERFLQGQMNAINYHTLALVAGPLPTATSLSAVSITGVSATLNGTVNARENTTTVSFEYGLDQNYGQIIAAAPPSLTSHDDTFVSAVINGLLPGTIYHYRVVAASAGGVVRGEDKTFLTLSDNSRLGSLVLSNGVLTPGFDSGITEYVVTVPYATDSVRVTPAIAHPKATVQVNGIPLASGNVSGTIPLPVGNTSIPVRVTAEDGITTLTYTVNVTRLPLEFVFNSASDVTVSAHGFSAGGLPVRIVMNFTPSPGTVLTMVNNTGLGFIHGIFGNLEQGQHVTLTFGGKDYDFVANYFGGTGNDLVLQWAATKALAWGLNNYGQVGNTSATSLLVPTRVNDTGALSGKILTAISGGYLHSLALCSDGSIAAWGYNVYGQLGDGGSSQNSVPVEVDRSGVLAGKTVIAVSAGSFHNLALCSDGTIVAWGFNNHGQLGNGSTATSRVPVLVKLIGALAGKHVVAVAAGAYHSFALCDDGSVVGWGYNDEGELGDGGTSTAMIPVEVNVAGVLSGKRVASISTGQYHTMALCADGTLVSWGYNNRGQLGDGTTTTSGSPVEIGKKGVLAGKLVISISAGNTHSLALCADGTLSSWGYNPRGQLGTGGTSPSLLPVAANLSGFTSPVGLASGSSHGLVRFKDGSIAAWGENTKGQLGDGTITQRNIPVALNVRSLNIDSRFMMMLSSGSAANHSLAVVALPELDAATRKIWPQIQQIHALVADVDLIRYAFGIAPGEDIAGKQPQPGWVENRFGVSFSEPAGVSGIVYGAEWSATLQPDGWIDIPDTGSEGNHIFTLPADAGPRVFMRLRVTRP